MQVPPTYSAVHIDGKRAYEIARKAEDSHAIEDTTIPAKPVNIKDIELLWYDDTKKQCQIRVECGKGTYIRSLARDIGKALNSGAYLTQLCRTRVGDIKIENCIELALGNNPSITAAFQEVLASDARIKQTWSNFFPQFSWQSGYSRIRQLQLSDVFDENLIFNYWVLGQISASQMLDQVRQ